MQRTVYISWSEARDMVAERLRQWIESMPPAERSLKLIWHKWLLSPYDMLVHVQRMDEIGKQIVVAEIRKISETTGINYVITG